MSYRSAYPVTPSDTVDVRANDVADGLYVGGTGAVAVIMEDGKAATFAAVPVGTTLDIAVRRVLATGTTATLLVALKH